jgi:nucleosome binding factor SPN SPT16 subunit
MSNKVLKHGFVKEMESVFEEEGKQVKHSEMAQKLDDIMEDPSKIGVKVPKDVIEACYFPIIQSGGCSAGYNIKPSATTDDETMTEDVVIVSLGAKFKHYCANVARTYVIDAVPKVEKTYDVLLRLQSECLASMQPGEKLSGVYARATKFLENKHPHLLPHLPKSLGFSLGLDFKDSNFVLTSKVDGSLRFKPNMVFSLAVGFADVELSAADRAKAKGAVKVSIRIFLWLHNFFGQQY